MVDPAERRVHGAPEGRPDPESGDDRDDADLGRACLELVERRFQRVLLRRWEQLLEIAEDRRLDVGILEQLSGDEQHQEREWK